MSDSIKAMTYEELLAEARRLKCACPNRESDLRRVRSLSGKTMGDLARFLGVPVSVVSALELDEPLVFTDRGPVAPPKSLDGALVQKEDGRE